ncbi:MAG: hypothetical protein GY828_07095 [Candidatus Gracilibacteria bacterium]|nr:hypothetical protein [Candidatus Gracilibacteria bacterium]
MKINTRKYAFTLAELMVVIAVIMIVGTAAARLDFNYISDGQRITGLNNDLISQFETIRNYSLLGKGVDTSIGVPDMWKIEYSLVGSGTSQVSYNMTGSSWIQFPEKHIFTQGGFYFEGIECHDITGASTSVSSGALEFSGPNIEIIGCSNAKKLSFQTNYKIQKETLTINSITGIME